jgi:hypothetical protein
MFLHITKKLYGVCISLLLKTDPFKFELTIYKPMPVGDLTRLKNKHETIIQLK